VGWVAKDISTVGVLCGCSGCHVGGFAWDMGSVDGYVVDAW